MDSEDAAVQDFLEILEEHRKNCERQGKYVEAEIAKNRLEELKLHEENRRRVYLSFCRNYCVAILRIIGSNAFKANCGKIGSGRSSHVRISAI